MWMYGVWDRDLFMDLEYNACTPQDCRQNNSFRILQSFLWDQTSRFSKAIRFEEKKCRHGFQTQKETTKLEI